MAAHPKFSTVSLVATVSAVSCMVLFLFMGERWMEHKRNPDNDLAFDAKLWRAARTEKEKELRENMSGDLLKRYLKSGMTRTQISALLGPPDDQRDVPGSDTPNQPDIVERDQYDMGNVWGDMAGQHHLLRIYFDTKGRSLKVLGEID
ncbi:MAG: hypothetical protein JWN14_387 [Chthonomonadales bacterium]|nr:hypothetical protein [Chthonomonadales bacterium]